MWASSSDGHRRGWHVRCATLLRRPRACGGALLRVGEHLAGVSAHVEARHRGRLLTQHVDRRHHPDVHERAPQRLHVAAAEEAERGEQADAQRGGGGARRGWRACAARMCAREGVRTRAGGGAKSGRGKSRRARRHRSTSSSRTPPVPASPRVHTVGHEPTWSAPLVRCRGPATATHADNGNNNPAHAIRHWVIARVVCGVGVRGGPIPRARARPHAKVTAGRGYGAGAGRWSRSRRLACDAGRRRTGSCARPSPAQARPAAGREGGRAMLKVPRNVTAVYKGIGHTASTGTNTFD